ncbi:MAG: hypothetical protein MUF87_12955 [Anaerolineae bacterium]|nr:hypothetical protein [Anaerolineae bacterium]
MLPLADDSALVCNLNAIAVEQREAHQRLMHTLFTAVIEICELPEGYRFRLPIESEADLQAWIANERRCCAFLQFRITQTSESLWLELTGSGEIKAFIQAQWSAL